MTHENTSGEIELTRDDILDEAEALSKKVMHVGAREALSRIQQGELEGTIFASKLTRLFALLGEELCQTNAKAAISVACPSSNASPTAPAFAPESGSGIVGNVESGSS